MGGIRTVTFRPLPHEFGLRINVVPSSISAAWVAGWEIGNAVRMAEKALREGGIPIFSYVKVRFAFSGSQLVAVGGSSHVYFIKKEKGNENKPGFPQSVKSTQPRSSPTDLARQDSKFRIPQSNLYQPEFGLLDKVLDKILHKNGEGSNLGQESLGQEEAGNGDLVPSASINLQQSLFSLIAFLSSRDDQKSQEMKNEILRDYFLFLSGVISESQFARKVRDFDMKAKTGLFISVYA